MGATTCAVSGLPIPEGAPVRYGLLSGCPYKDQIVCTMKDIWFPRVWPVKAAYDDYGRVRDIQEGPVKDSWLAGFRVDLVERGWGPNTCHDVDTKKDWTFDHMQAALLENRVLVRHDVRLFTRDILKPGGPVEYETKDFFPKRKIAKGVPTRRRVEKALLAAGLRMFAGNHDPKSVTVRHAGYGRVSVRRGDYGEATTILKRAQKALEKTYATMLTEGPINQGPELLVRPLPGTKGYYFSKPSKSEGIPLPVSQFLVREDVWQGLTKLKFEEALWVGKKFVPSIVSVTSYREGAQKVWDALCTPQETFFVGPEELLQDEALTWRFLKNDTPFTIGLGTSFTLVARAFRDGKMTVAQADAFLDEAAEFAFLGHVLQPTRYYWRPSYLCGPSYGGWEESERFLRIVTKIARKEAKADAERRKEWES
jgi:hypothetical protein